MTTNAEYAAAFEAVALAHGRSADAAAIEWLSKTPNGVIEPSVGTLGNDNQTASALLAVAAVFRGLAEREGRTMTRNEEMAAVLEAAAWANDPSSDAKANVAIAQAPADYHCRMQIAQTLYEMASVYRDATRRDDKAKARAKEAAAAAAEYLAKTPNGVIGPSREE